MRRLSGLWLDQRGEGDGLAGGAIVAIVLLILALIAVLFFFRGGAEDDDLHMDVDINRPPGNSLAEPAADPLADLGVRFDAEVPAA